jgi:hypothetical protein
MARLLMFVLLLACTNAAAQYTEIELPFPDTLRFKVQFIDDSCGWVSSRTGCIMHTTDAGQSWQKYRCPVKPDLREIKFSSRNYGIAWAEGSLREGNLYQTSNAGKDWKRVPVPDSLRFTNITLPPTPQPEYTINTVFPNYIFYQGRREWAIGNQLRSERLSAFSRDGGNNWEYHTSVSFGLNACYELALDTNRWVAISPGYKLPDITPISAFGSSTDYGATWTWQAVWDNVNLTNAVFQDSKRGMVFSDTDSGSYSTTDGGETWINWHDAFALYTGALVSDSVMYGISVFGNLFRHHLSRNWWRERILSHTAVLSISAIGRKVYALSYERKLYLIDDTKFVLSGDEPEPAKTSFYISPNPARGAFSITRKWGFGRTVFFTLCNSAGIVVPDYGEIELRPHETHRTIKIERLPSGMYFLIERGERTRVHSIAVIK